MMILIKTLFFLLLFPGVSLATDPITQHGITWTFAEGTAYSTGQFLNGDYWVVDPGTGVKIINITPGYATTPRIINGSMINPSTAMQGYDNMFPTTYEAGKNVGVGISPSTPLTLSSNTSLVSIISNLVSEPHPSYVDKVAVLTCLSSPAPPGSFRPGISGTNKTLYNISNVNFSLLRKLAVPVGQTVTSSTLATYANYFQTAWLSHDGNGGRYMHPKASGMDNYHYYIKFAEAAVLLHLDFTDEEKRSLLINYIQLGLDLYSFLESGGEGWYPNGGHGNGRKWPILFAGIMLDSAPIKNIGQLSGSYINNATFNANGSISNYPPNYKFFGEDGQTFYVNQYMVDLTSNTRWIYKTDGTFSNYYNTSTWLEGNPGGATVGPWNPDTRTLDGEGNPSCRPYSTAMIGMPEFGIKYSNLPRESDSAWSAEYRYVGAEWAGFVLAARMMGAKSIWNHNAIFDYVDRFMEISAGRSDPFGYQVYMEDDGYSPGGIIGAMWDAYRTLYNEVSFLSKFPGGVRTINSRLFTMPAQ